MSQVKPHVLVLEQQKHDLTRLVQDVRNLKLGAIGVRDLRGALFALMSDKKAQIQIAFLDFAGLEERSAEFLQKVRMLRPDVILCLIQGPNVQDLTGEGPPVQFFRNFTKPWNKQTLRDILQAAVNRYEAEEKKGGVLGSLGAKKKGLKQLMTKKLSLKRSKGTVLCVDDDEDVLRILQRFLESEGFDCLVASDPTKAIQIANEDREIRLVITDQFMPQMKGTTMLNQIRRWRADLAGIVLTGMGNPEKSRETEEKTQFFRYLEKPWNDDELLATVKGALVFREQSNTNPHPSTDLDTIDIRTMLKAVQKDTVEEAKRKSIPLNFQIQMGKPFPVGDIRRLRKILVNLIMGALDLPGRGSVTVRLRLHDNRRHLTIETLNSSVGVVGRTTVETSSPMAAVVP